MVKDKKTRSEEKELTLFIVPYVRRFGNQVFAFFVFFFICSFHVYFFNLIILHEERSSAI